MMKKQPGGRDRLNVPRIEIKQIARSVQIDVFERGVLLKTQKAGYYRILCLSPPQTSNWIQPLPAYGD